MFYRLFLLLFVTFLSANELPRGCSYENIILSGPISIHLLEIDPEFIHIESCLGKDSGIGIESLSSMSERKGAFAAINGSFFQMNHPYEGISSNLFKHNGEILFSSRKRNGAIRGAMSWIPDTKFTLIDRVHLQAFLETSEGILPIHAINRVHEKGTHVLYTPQFHSTTLTSEGSREYLIQDNQVTECFQTGNASIPKGGYIFCTDQELPYFLSTEVLFKYQTIFHPEWAHLWNEVPYIVSGTPVLIQDGELVDFFEEKTLTSFIICPHPRTAVGIKENGNWLIAVVDGRSKVSKGMIIHDLAQFLLDQGCVNAINLDGGGSTAIYLNGKIVNYPCGSHEGEKGVTGQDLKVGDAILFFAP